ncbi:MAG: sodium-dependent bicarbonate transport family permease [Bacteroidia bacterium]|jgi:hypothetical protein|nr:sodium-dependent bicarbonate transport family permease [Bacteroidia bacterium]
MIQLLDPVVLFFMLGVFAGLIKSDLRIPQSFHNTLSIYLLLSIGIKGGIELYKNASSDLLLPALGTIFLGVLITFIAFYILHRIGRFDKNNAIAIATHYGSVSAVTFAVVLNYLHEQKIGYEEFCTVLLVLLEIPSIATGVAMARMNNRDQPAKLGKIVNEVLFGKTILLLLGGLFIGWVTAYTDNKALNFFFFDLFKGFLAIFMLEMGVVAAEKTRLLKKVGPFLLGFGVGMPLISALLGIVIAWLTGLSMGGAIVLATMAASASYIAAPAAMKIAIPKAKPTLYLTSALGITFPFNVIIGIRIYHAIAAWFYSLLD